MYFRPQYDRVGPEPLPRVRTGPVPVARPRPRPGHVAWVFVVILLLFFFWFSFFLLARPQRGHLGHADQPSPCPCCFARLVTNAALKSCTQAGRRPVPQLFHGYTEPNTQAGESRLASADTRHSSTTTTVTSHRRRTTTCVVTGGHRTATTTENDFLRPRQRVEATNQGRN